MLCNVSIACRRAYVGGGHIVDVLPAFFELPQKGRYLKSVRKKSIKVAPYKNIIRLFWVTLSDV